MTDPLVPSDLPGCDWSASTMMPEGRTSHLIVRQTRISQICRVWTEPSPGCHMSPVVAARRGRVSAWSTPDRHARTGHVVRGCDRCLRDRRRGHHKLFGQWGPHDCRQWPSDLSGHVGASAQVLGQRGTRLSAGCSVAGGTGRRIRPISRFSQRTCRRSEQPSPRSAARDQDGRRNHTIGRLSQGPDRIT